MAASKRRCKFDLTQLVAFCTNFERTCSDNNSLAFFDVKKQELDRGWNKLVESYEDYMLGDDDAQKEDIKDDMSLKYEEASDLYQAQKIKIVEKIKSFTAESSQHFKSRSTLKLPACDIQIFEGGYSKWPAFRDMFQAVIGKDQTVAPAQKLYYLRSKVRGEAYQSIKDFDLVDDNFDLAWEKLKNRFENRRKFMQFLQLTTKM